MERVLTDLIDFSIKKVLTLQPAHLKAAYKKKGYALSVRVQKKGSKQALGERAIALGFT